MNIMFNAGLYSSIINHNVPAAIGFSIMKDLHNDKHVKHNNKHEKHNDKHEKHNNDYEQHNNDYEQHIKHTRKYIIPEDIIRCTAITQKGERCAC